MGQGLTPFNERHSRNILAEMFGEQDKLDIASEVRALREEISTLRAMLLPASSVILTGAEVVEEFKKMRRR